MNRFVFVLLYRMATVRPKKETWYGLFTDGTTRHPYEHKYTPTPDGEGIRCAYCLFVVGTRSFYRERNSLNAIENIICAMMLVIFVGK